MENPERIDWTEEPPPDGYKGKQLRSGGYLITPSSISGRRFNLMIGDTTVLTGNSLIACKQRAEQEAADIEAPTPEDSNAADFGGVDACIVASWLDAAARPPTRTDVVAAAAIDNGKPLVEVLLDDEPSEAIVGPSIVIGGDPEPEPPDPQQILNDLYWQHGKNFLTWPNAAELCTAAGIDKNAITRAMLQTSAAEFAQRVQGIIAADIAPLVWTGPTSESTQTSEWDVWTTECKQLRVCRCIPRHAHEAPAFRVSMADVVSGNHIWKVTDHHHRTFERALHAAEDVFKTQRGIVGPIDSNLLAILKEAKKLELDVLPSQQKPYNAIDPESINEPQKDEETIMHVTEETARKFFIDCGTKAEIVNEWTVKRLAHKLNEEGVELDAPESDEFKKLFHDREAWLAKGKEIKIGVAPPAKAKVAKPSKNGAAKADGKLSMLDAAITVLKGKDAMNCKDMIDAMAAKKLWESPGGKTPHATLSAAIGKEISTAGRTSRFKKTAPGQFALKA